uniref:hypothetical protein n=1 Tax=uncultured Draconibacterium sp. TaxID=1573823 RepID=UPI0032173E23
MKKILFVDPLSPRGHVNFNSIYIQSLYKLTENLDFSFKQGYENHFKIKSQSIVYPIPKKLFISTRNKFTTRYNQWKVLRFIKNHIPLQSYDIVIFSSYEEISLSLAFIRKKVFLINHNNIRNIENPIKRYFFKKASARNTNIVFEDYIKGHLEGKGISNLITIPHGIPTPHSMGILSNQNMCEKFSFLNNFDRVIFSPSASSSDMPFLTKLNSDSSFLSFLSQNNILFIVRGDFQESQSRNLLVINNFLTDTEYQFLLLRSDIILISYPQTHLFRVSAILFECIANNKFCVLSNIPALRIYAEYFNYNPYFESISSLLILLKNLISNKQLTDSSPFKNTNKLNPDLGKILNEK